MDRVQRTNYLPVALKKTPVQCVCRCLFRTNDLPVALYKKHLCGVFAGACTEPMIYLSLCTNHVRCVCRCLHRTNCLPVALYKPCAVCLQVPVVYRTNDLPVALKKNLCGVFAGACTEPMIYLSLCKNPVRCVCRCMHRTNDLPVALYKPCAVCLQVHAHNQLSTCRSVKKNMCGVFAGACSVQNQLSTCRSVQTLCGVFAVACPEPIIYLSLCVKKTCAVCLQVPAQNQ